MKAVQIDGYGGIDQIQVKDDLSQPAPSAGEVEVEVYAASINPIDWKVREGYLKDYVPLNFPMTVGGDFSGVVKSVGEGVTQFSVGDEVFGQGGVLNGGSGSFAQYLIAPLKKIVIKPGNVDHEQAAALPLVGIAALQGIEDHIDIAPGAKILIHGGAGGIGSLAVQIAKYHGAYVIATASTKDKEFVAGLGADQVVDYKTEKFEEMVKDLDAIFDTAGGEAIAKSYQVLKKGGILVSMTGEADPQIAQEHGVSVINENVDSNPERLARLVKLVEEGNLRVQVDKVFDLSDAKAAFEHQEQGHPRGKVVLKVKS